MTFGLRGNTILLPTWEKQYYFPIFPSIWRIDFFPIGVNNMPYNPVLDQARDYQAGAVRGSPHHKRNVLSQSRYLLRKFRV